MPQVDPTSVIVLLIGVMLGAAGIALRLPRAQTRRNETLLSVVSALCLVGFVGAIALLLEPPAGLPSDAEAAPTVSSVESMILSGFYYGFALISVIAALMMLTSRDPVHSALWFALVVLSGSGLFIMAGASFLAAGTVIVYAGAIIVTFLFVIMLAQSHGRAIYDRSARQPNLAAILSFLILASVGTTVIFARAPQPSGEEEGSVNDQIPRLSNALTAQDPLTDTDDPMALVLARGVSETSRFPKATEDGQVNAQHVASLGACLYSDHLIAIEVVGILLFVALIAAVAIATPRTSRTIPKAETT